MLLSASSSHIIIYFIIIIPALCLIFQNFIEKQIKEENEYVELQLNFISIAGKFVSFFMY